MWSRADRADLYAYFFERGIGVLKEGGRLGYISSSTFFRTGSGENLRRFLGDRVTIEAVVEFGDVQIEGVTTYPAIVTLRKGASGQSEAVDGVNFLKVDALPENLEAEFTAKARTMSARGWAPARGNSRMSRWRGCATKSSRARKPWGRSTGPRSMGSRQASMTPSSSTPRPAIGWCARRQIGRSAETISARREH